MNNTTKCSIRVKEAIAGLEIETIAGEVGAALAQGCLPMEILAALSSGLQAVGEKFESGEYFLVDLILAGEAMKAGLAVLQPHLETGSVQKRGTVVLATVHGDVHEIGKNLVGMMLRSAGYAVVDLGIDVPVEKILAAVQEHGAGVVGLSVLLTPAVGELRAVCQALEKAGLREKVKVLAGGACTTPEMVKTMGCDGHGADAVAAVRLVEGT